MSGQSVIGQLGTAALAVGLVCAVAATLLWLRVAQRAPAACGPSPSSPARRHARIATIATLAAAALTCAALEWALLRHDFGVRFVAENGGRDVPLYYTITSLWAALDGSLLLWLLILGSYAGLLGRAVPSHARQLHPWAMTVVSAVLVFFFALTYFAANPFRAVQPTPADGPGPNPLLQQHPAMGLHPPLLYAGYIGLVIPFAYAVAALLAGSSGDQWLRAVRRWTLVAWALLTAGIALGAWWSYAVLGWGGYWAWDPVENASLLPWLTATAFLHSALAQRRRAIFAGWNIALACASFLLVLLGTFLTRSGAVASVHAFTQSPLGPMLLGFVLLLTVAVIALVGWRAERLAPGEPIGAPLCRESAFLGNAVLLTTLTAVVLTGTVFPLVAQAVTGTRAAVGPPYFNRAAVPVAIAVLVLMAVGPLLRWRADTPAALARRLIVPAGAGLGTVAAVGLLSRPGPAALAAFGCAAFILAGAIPARRSRATSPRRSREYAHGSISDRVNTSLIDDEVLDRRGPAGGLRAIARRAGGAAQTLVVRRRAYGGRVAHAGIALVAAGVAASSAYPSATEQEIGVGDTITVHGVSARLVAVERRSGDAGMWVRVRLALVRDGRPAGAAAPELRYHPAREMTVSVPAIRSAPARDIYATLIAVAPDGRRATLRLAVNPLIGLIWAGAAITALGGLLAVGRRSGSRGTRVDAPPGGSPEHDEPPLPARAGSGA
ncbi:cytochrome c-type biogenesis CcmF C-terminal domain-containing protein [Micromonospora sp. NPDC049679]|uniref:heme lyase CcmF/NrfE family subunit n=1 Tax=Micromonospora sp. NPDC049679 TaxID=3155920 RepID=UPI0033C1157F